MHFVEYLDGNDERVDLIECIQDFFETFKPKNVPPASVVATIMNNAVEVKGWQSPQQAYDGSAAFVVNSMVYGLIFCHLEWNFGVKRIVVLL